MAKGISILFTLVFLVASLIIMSQYEVTSMTSTAQGVNLTNSTPEMQSAYNASTHNTIAAISITQYTTLLVSIFAVVIILVVLLLMVKRNQRKLN